MMVVLPEPLGPSNPMISPFSTLNETLFTASVAPKYLVSSWTSIMKPALAPAAWKFHRARAHWRRDSGITFNVLQIAPGKKCVSPILGILETAGRRSQFSYFIVACANLTSEEGKPMGRL